MSLLLLLGGAGVVAPAECAFDGDAFDEDAFNACPPAVVPPSGSYLVRPQAVLRVDDEDDIAVVVAVLRHHLRL